jgi:poly(3-hydroxybutyrate) depolymerase
MPYQLVHKGVVREFNLHIPWAWEYWHQRVFDEDGREGLPLVIALHGGLQDPEEFATNWDFPSLSNPNDPNNWEDRFVVIYPFGFPSTQVLTVPGRSWNTGFAGEYPVVQSDVSFIGHAIAAVEQMLQRQLDELGVTRPPIDADRRFIFGYSAGGMMAYRLARKVPDTFAALWVMSGAIGGRAHELLTSTITNFPQGSSSASLFAHHGELDVIVPPGPIGDVTGREYPMPAIDLYAATGMPIGDRPVYKGTVRHLAAAVEAYRAYNDCERNPTVTLNNVNINGNLTSKRYEFRQASGASNPEVIAYVDPDLDHTNYPKEPVPAGQVRYFGVREIWDFFKGHPRIPI